MNRLLFSLIWALITSFNLIAQGTQVLIQQITPKGKQDGQDVYEATLTVKSGALEPRSELLLVQNGAIKAYVTIPYLYETLKAGETTKYPEVMLALGAPLVKGAVLASDAQAGVQLPVKRDFSFETATAFLGAEPNSFSTFILNQKGAIQVGDQLEYLNYKGQKGVGRITALEVAGMHPRILIDGLPKDVNTTIFIQAESGVDFSEAKVRPIGTMPASTATTQAKSEAPVAKGQVRKIPVNTVLENEELKITLHHLIKFNPDPNDNAYDLFKVDYTLDYYIADLSVENKTSHPVDAGMYLLRLNFFSADGKSADEFTRLFKAKESDAEVQKDANKVDMNVFGGTGKIPMAQVLVKYEAHLPDYETKHRDAAKAINQEIGPKQKIRSEIATIMGVPPSYKIEGIGTWSGSVFSRKNFLFSALRI